MIRTTRLAVLVVPIIAAATAALAASSSLAGEGEIVGVVDDPRAVKSLAALDRANDKTHPGEIDLKSGRFVVKGLAKGSKYDLIIDLADGARLEGVDLGVPPSDFEEEQPLSAEDVATIKAQVKSLNKFEDEVEVLAIVGNVQHASVLINKLRTRPFVNSKPGEVVWRAELWRFERPEETWVKVQDELFLVLHRERIPAAEYKKKSITFDPALGGLAIGADAPRIDLGKVALPRSAPGVRLRRSSDNRDPEDDKGGRR